MRSNFCRISASFFCAFILLLPLRITGQQTLSVSAIPDAPTPNSDLVAAEAYPAVIPQQSSTAGATPDSSSTPPGEAEHQKAAEQIRQQEQQRVVGVIPTFNVSYIGDAVSMTARQKIGLAFRSSTDPVAFAGAFIVAGYHEAEDDDTGFGWGAEGYFKRSGAAYLDAFDGAMIGNGILPALLHQDPRYFRLGHGSTTHRVLYALFTNVACKQDKTRKWGPNVSNVGGNIIAGAISNLYYPSQNSGWSQTISNGMIVTAEGGVGALFNEFWPDLSRRFLHKDPTNGRDAQLRAADRERKKARQE